MDSTVASSGVSRLLAGSRRPEPVPQEVYVGDQVGTESNPEDSGILEIQFTEETTSPEESALVSKLARPARKCKWCDNFARGASNLCARHGGGRRCHCGKLARGPSNLCMKHGGGRRCALPTCNAAAVYKSDYCRSHGGGKRCSVEGCVASVYSAKESLCFKHGGGTRCKYEEGCSKAPIGKTDFCIKHGGGKRCSVDRCAKAAVMDGLCVRHHQGSESSPMKSEVTSPLQMISMIPISIKEDDDEMHDITTGPEPNPSDLAS
jgi:hypothetical protein